MSSLASSHFIFALAILCLSLNLISIPLTSSGHTAAAAASIHSFSPSLSSSCLLTPCDSPSLITQWQRYIDTTSIPSIYLSTTLYILTMDNYTNPIISNFTAEAEFQFINQYYSNHSIGFNFTITMIPSSYYRRRLLLPFCDPNTLPINSSLLTAAGTQAQCDIGSQFALFCNYSMTGFGGGLCLPLEQQQIIKNNSQCEHVIANGECDTECNYAFWDYDGGDCCLTDDSEANRPAYENCLEPLHPLRRWLTTDQIRSIHPSPSPRSFNLYLANCSESTLCGGSTILPWNFSPQNSGSQGSIFLAQTFDPLASPDNGGGMVPVHEFGHTFGLLHTFNGLEMFFLTSQIPFSYACTHRDQYSCVDLVQYPVDQHGSLISGDLVDDTRVAFPTFGCVDPVGSDCADSPWYLTPIDNVMGFNLNCPNLKFTLHQRARMHCYINQTYLEWITNQPSPYPPSAVTGFPNENDGKNRDKKSSNDLLMFAALGFSVLVLVVCGIVGFWCHKRRMNQQQREQSQDSSSNYQLVQGDWRHNLQINV